MTAPGLGFTVPPHSKRGRYAAHVTEVADTAEGALVNGRTAKRLRKIARAVTSGAKLVEYSRAVQYDDGASYEPSGVIALKSNCTRAVYRAMKRR